MGVKKLYSRHPKTTSVFPLFYLKSWKKAKKYLKNGWKKAKNPYFCSWKKALRNG